ncbi:hypothetical protein TNCV_1426861 [Trichonephila clavipes]|nr:hypothetical protein TNCV_1426861 [Trichonephila clavipes]
MKTNNWKRGVSIPETLACQESAQPSEALQRTSSYTQVIRSNRLRWLSHIWRSPENNQTRAYTFNLRILWDLEQEEDHQQGGYR